MKKIRIILSAILIAVLILGVITLIKKKDYSYYLVMGDYVSNKQAIGEKQIDSFSSFVGNFLKEKKMVNEVNNQYLKNNMTSKKMLEMIESETYKSKGSDLVSLIKKSKYISITLGLNDVINQIKYDGSQNKIIYDKEIVTNKIEIFKHNYYKILEEIKDINKNATILVVGIYPFYGNQELSMLINDVSKNVAEDNNCYYVDVSDINDKYMYQENELYLTSFGQEEISKKVISLIKQIEKI